MTRISTLKTIPILALLLLASPGWGATVPLGRANPFKPLIQKRSTLPVVLPSLPPLREPVLVEQAPPQLVGIIADEKGAIAALKFDGKTEFLRPREVKRNLHLLSLGKNQALVEVKGKPFRLLITDPTKPKKIEE